MRSSARTAALAAVTAVFAVVGSACSDSGSGSSSPSKSSGGSSASAKTVTVHSGKLGKFLAGGGGKTLYLFEKDKTSKSTCTGACTKAWPPMVVKGSPAAASGVQKGLLGTSSRSGGGKQVTYKGHPLYYYQGDGKAGNTNGQGLNQFGAKWYVVGTDGKAIKSKSKGGGGGGGGGY